MFIKVGNRIEVFKKGIIKKILVKENESAPIDAVLCEIEETK